MKTAIGLDLGGTSLKYALCTLDGQVLHESSRPSEAEKDLQIILDNLADAIREMQDISTKFGEPPDLVGIGTPGSVDIDRGHLLGSTPNFKSWKNVAISEELEKRVNIPVFVDNDANVMAIGESKFGAGKNYKDIICITVGTGIGGGIILDGEMYRGTCYCGAELGHTTILVDGIQCKCGNNGCLEQYASATAIIRQYEAYAKDAQIKLDGKQKDVRYIFDLYRNADPVAKRAIDEAIYYLGRGIASFINIFNPQIVIIGGGVAEAGEIYIGQVRKIALQYAMEMSRQGVEIIAASLGNDAGYLGAIAFAHDQLRKRTE
jgi:glucokinase